MTLPARGFDSSLRVNPSEPCGSERGLASIRVIVGIAAVVVVGFLAVAMIFGVVVPPGAMGIRNISFGPRQGLQAGGLQSGYHWRIPGYSEIYTIPANVVVYDFHREGVPGGGGQTGTRAGLEVQTADRATVVVDLSLLVRFYTGPSEEGTGADEAHAGPAALLKEVGVSPDDWERRIRIVAGNAMRKTLGQLSTAQFYLPERRDPLIHEAHTLMNSSLRPLGINIDSVLVRRYTYDDVIEQAIFGKNLQELERELAQKQGDFAKAEADVRQVTAQGDAKIRTLQVGGDNRVSVLRSEGDLYLAQKQAEGDLLVAKAQAEVDRLRAGALARSAAAEVYVARELAPLVSSLRGGVVTDLNPYDLQAWMSKLGVERGEGGR